MSQDGGAQTARLVTLQGRGTGTSYLLGPANTLGRDPENTIQVLDEKISRHHAVLRRSDGVWTIQDLGSRNGTFLGKERLTRALELSGGEEIQLGDTMLRFELLSEDQGASRPAAATPPEPLEVPEVPEPPTGPGKSLLIAPPPPIDEEAETAEADPGELEQAASPSEITVKNSLQHAIDLDEMETNPMVQAAADVSGRALFRADSDVTTEELARRLEVSFQINRALSQLMELEDLADTILDELFKAIPASRGSVLVRRAGDELEPVTIREPGNQGSAASRRIPISRTLLARAVTQREAVLMTDVLADSALAGSASIVAQGIKSAITAPLIYQDDLMGVLHLENRTARSFTKDDLDLVASAASQAAIAMANARLLGKVKQEAEHRTNLQRYLAPELVEQLLDGKVTMEMEGATCQCTLLFSDLRGFTAMSEKISTKEVFRTLNVYFQRMVDVILEHGGSIDKFMGDAIMAVWGVPSPREDDAVRAVKAAIKMQQALASLNIERESQGKPPIHMGVGINSGPVLAGNLGAKQRMEYTVIGDNVNLASRLEGLTKAGQVLISESTMALVRQVIDASELPPVKVKGKQHPVKVFEIKGLQVKSEDAGVTRTHDRLKTSVKISLVNEASGRVHVGVLADISAGGAGVKFLPEHIQGLEEGAAIRIPFGGRTEPSAPAVRGKVVRLIHGKDKQGNVLFKAGIQFLDPPEQVKRLARSLVKL